MTPREQQSAGTSGGTHLAPADHIDAVERESARFRAVLADVPAGTRVPGCPEWDVDDLLGHLTEVQWFWTQVLRRRPLGPEDDGFPEHPGLPSDRAGLLAAAEQASADLVAELRAADPAEPAWSWSADRTVGFTVRRQAHEALVHRLDAEQAAGAVTALDPALAADGVHEALAVMFGAEPPFGSWSPRDAWVRVDLTDTGDRVWAQVGWFEGTTPSGEVLDGDDLRVRPDPGHDPHVVVRGTAADVDLWLWHRLGDEVVEVTGDADVRDRFVAAVSHPVD